MARADALVAAVTRAVQRADSAQDVRAAVCEAAVDTGYEFACFNERDEPYVTANAPDVEPPAAEAVVPTYRGVSAASAASDSDEPGRPSEPGSPSGPDTDGPSGLADGDAGTPTEGGEVEDAGTPVEDGTGNADQPVDGRDDAVQQPAQTREQPTHTQVTCIAREAGYTITVPVVDRDQHFGTFALGAPERVENDAERDALAAAGVAVGQALSRHEAVQERDQFLETLRRERRQFEKLHSVAAGMVGCEDAENIYHLAIDAAENILEFDICGVDIVQDGCFVPVATSTGMQPGDSKQIPIKEGIAGKTYEENRTIIVDDVAAHPLADPANPDHQSILSVPIDGVGVFQAGSTERNAFSEADAELVELLMAHVSETLQRLRSEEALRGSEQKYRTLIEQSHDAVVIYRNGDLAFANQRAAGLFGRDRDVLLDADACELLHPEDRPKLERIVGELTGEVGRQQTFEGRIRRPNGNVRFCEFSATSIQYEGGLAVLGSLRDITERKARERDLERQNERLEEFASVVSHDLRSPINVARGSVDLARNTEDPSHLDRAAEALDRMEDLVEDILQLARQGRLVDETDAVAVDEVAADAWRSVDAPDATLTVETDATIEADRTRLRELFENLFRNAVEHGSTSPRSHVHGDAVEHGSTSPDSQVHQDAVEHGSTSPRSHAHEDAVERGDSDVSVWVVSLDDGFAVVDDGPGLPAESHDRVFDRGFTSAEDGTGFGLAIVESIADAHGWTVDAVPPDVSEGVTAGDSSRGARFEIRGCSPE